MFSRHLKLFIKYFKWLNMVFFSFPTSLLTCLEKEKWWIIFVTVLRCPSVGLLFIWKATEEIFGGKHQNMISKSSEPKKKKRNIIKIQNVSFMKLSAKQSKTLWLKQNYWVERASFPDFWMFSCNPGFKSSEIAKFCNWKPRTFHTTSELIFLTPVTLMSYSASLNSK